MKGSQPTAIRDILKKTIGQINPKERDSFSEEEIASIWKTAAGAPASRHSFPSALKAGVLVINVDSPAWVYQINLEKREIEKKINSLIKQKKPISIRLRTGEGRR